MGDLVPDARGGSYSLARHWLLGRYWLFAWALLPWVVPLALWKGTRVDAWGLAAYVTVTAVSWLIARRSPWHGVYVHLVSVFPYWIWYVRLDGGLPQVMGGVSGYAALLVFPVVTLVALDGLRGAGIALTASVAGLFLQYASWTERAVGGFLLATGVMIGLVFRRLAQDLEEAREELRQQANVDLLTGVANRRGLAERVDSFDGTGAFLFVDLSRFKTVNDVFGHVVGDLLLARVARRLLDAAGDAAVVARVGGDEFVVLAKGADEERGGALADALAAAVEAPFDLGGQVVHVGAHVGVAIWPRHGVSLVDLLRAADRAMYDAKERGSRYAVVGADLDGLPRRALEVDLWRALEGEELELHYQVVCDLEDGRIAGAEALVRWRHPERGMLPPATFIPMAEDTGQIVNIDRLVVRRAIRQLEAWRAEGLDLWVAVNVSARTLDDAAFLPELEGLLVGAPDVASRLVLELTESAAMRDPDMIVARLERLRELGVASAIDDFGMGYSSLAYLRRLPATHLKLDRAFTSGIGQHGRDEEVIEMVLQLADRLGLHVVAEGVELDAQRAWLADRRCRFAQGYGIARPCDTDAFMELMRHDSGFIRRSVPAASGPVPRVTGGDEGDEPDAEAG